ESGVKRALDEEFGNAALKRKEKAEAKKKAAEDKKKEAEAKKKKAAAKKKVAEAKKKEAELKKKQEAELKNQTRLGQSTKSSLADIIDQVVAEQNEFAPESDVDNSELVRSAIIKEFPGEKCSVNSKRVQGLRMKMAADILAEGGNILTGQMLLGRT
ncbi:BnaAnng22200D, partial [Brassica napus]